MKLKIVRYVLAGSVLSTASLAAADNVSVGPGVLSLAELCAHTRLSEADQADCRTRVTAATTEIQRLEARRTFEAKAGLRAGSMSGAGVTSSSESADAPPPTGVDHGTPTTDPLTAPAAKPKVD